MPGLYVINGEQITHGTDDYIQQAVVATTQLDCSKWQFLTATYTSTDAKIYINGILIASATHDYMVPKNAARLNNNLGKGSNQEETTPPYSLAYLDDLRIYNRALNITEINNLMNCPGKTHIYE